MFLFFIFSFLMETFKSKDIFNLFRISRQQLKAWREIGLFTPQKKTEKGHYRYNYHDLVALKTILTLKRSGFSTQHIKEVFKSLKKRFGVSTNPFVQKSIVVVNNRIAYVEKGKLYDALTGQGFLFEMILSQEIEFEVKNDIYENMHELNNIKKTSNRKKIYSTKKKLILKALKS